MTVVRKISTASSLGCDLESVAEKGLSTMNGKCTDPRHRGRQQPRSTRFKSVVRRVLVALSFRLGRGAVAPPSSPAAAADDGSEGADGCGGLVVTSTSTVATTVCRLEAVEEEQRSRCNSPVSAAAINITASDYDPSTISNVRGNNNQCLFTSAHSSIVYASLHSVYYARESEGICFHRRWFVCVSVCLSVSTMTEKIADGFAPHFMRRFLVGKERPSSCFVTIGRRMWK